MRLKTIYKTLFPNFKVLIRAILIGISTAGYIYFGFLQRHFFSYRYLAYAVGISGVAALLSAWINIKIIDPRVRNFSKPIRVFLVIASLILTIFLLFNIKLQPFYAILPDTTMEIDFTIGEIPENEEGIRLKWIETGQGYVPSTYINYYGKWERKLGNTFFSPEQTVKMVWTGKVGVNTEIALRKTVYNQPISVTWNGESESYNLRGSPEEDLLIRNNFKIRPVYFLPFVLSAATFFFYVILIFLVSVGSWDLKTDTKKSSKRFTWLYYALPMLCVWLLILFIFWPGFLTSDSLTIWNKAVNGNIDDWQSAFYTLVLSFLIKMIPSPAFILILQVLFFALVTARGLRVLENIGVPKGILWFVSILMAIFPPNLLFSITLWKDIPYAISILALTIFLTEIVISNGQWSQKTHRWMALGVSAFLVAILRHNGGPSALLSLLFLPILYKKYWKQFSASMLIALVLFFLVKGPIFNRVIEDNGETGQSNLVYLHHIGAHLDAGTEFTQSEIHYLDQFLPTAEWNYDCCYVGSLSYDPDLERIAFLKSTRENRGLALSLFLRDPGIDISHALCSGELSYKFLNTQQCDHMKSLHGFNSTKPGKEDWIGEIYNTGIHENSFFPGLMQPVLKTLRLFGFFDSNFVIYLRPAFWFFLALISISIWVIRSQKIITLLPIIPILSQSLILLLISFAPAFRYYYSNCVVGIFMLCLIFVPRQDDAVKAAA